MTRSTITVSAEGKGIQALPTRRIPQVGPLQLLVVALLIAVVAIGLRAAFVQPTPRTISPTISINRDAVLKPHGTNQMPKRITTQAAQPA